MTFKDKLGNMHEAMIDMEKIRKTIYYMTRKRTCPVYGTERYYYRFAKDIVFSRDNMAILANSLDDPSGPSLARNLRRIDQDTIHDRGDKPIQILELKSWLQSGYRYGSAIWDSFKVKCANSEKQGNANELLKDLQQYYHCLIH